MKTALTIKCLVVTNDHDFIMTHAHCNDCLNAAEYPGLGTNTASPADRMDQCSGPYEIGLMVQ